MGAERLVELGGAISTFGCRLVFSGSVRGDRGDYATHARNLAVAFSVPFGFLIGGGAIPTFIGAMGDAGSFARGFVVTGALITFGGVLALLLKLPEVKPAA